MTGVEAEGYDEELPLTHVQALNPSLTSFIFLVSAASCGERPRHRAYRPPHL